MNLNSRRLYRSKILSFISKIESPFLWVISFQHFMEGNFKNSITNLILLLVSNVIR